MKRHTLFAAAAVALLLAFAIGAWLYGQTPTDRAPELAADKRALLERKHAPTLGRADAPVTIVEFFDPACETCREFYPFVKKIMADHPGKIRLVVRYAPFHPGSDKVVAILEAARRQDKFWPTLEALLASQADWSPHHAPQLDRVWRHLEGLGLNLAQLRADMLAPEIDQIIMQDLLDASALAVTKTPEFFVDGRPLPSFGYEPLQQSVDQALNAAAGRR